MKKLLIVLIFISLIIGFNKVQSQTFCYNKGDKMLNIGISPFTYGFGYSYHWSGYKNSSSLLFPALNLNYQVGIHEFISIGGTVGRFSRKYKSTYTHNGYVDEYTDKYSYTMIGVLAEVHLDNLLEELEITSLNLGENLDLYVGINTGVFISSWKSDDVWYDYQYNSNNGQWGYIKNSNKYSGSSSSGYARSYIGGRYMFKPNLGGFLELGYASFGYMNLGVTFKL